MTMNPARLPGRQTTGGGMGGSAVHTPTPAPSPAPTSARPVPAPAPAPQPQPTAQQPQSFTGLDPLTRSLIEAAPLVPATPEPAVPLTEPPTQIASAPPRRGLKQPAVLVALGGSLAAGLLFLSGAAKPRTPGYPRAAGQSASVATTPSPILPAALPAPSSWLIVGGRA